MPFKDLPEGQTHSFNDGCGEKTHNCMCKEGENCCLCDIVSKEDNKFVTGQCSECDTPVEVICPCEVANFRNYGE